MKPKSAQKINILDFEASGMGRNSYPIEVAVILNNGEIFNSLIKPQDDWTAWSRKAEKVHNISRMEVVEHGKSPRYICEELNRICEGEQIYSDCWTLDHIWLGQLYFSAQMEPSFQLLPIEYMLNDEELAEWGNDKKIMAEKEAMTMHRALPDAHIIRCVMEEKVKARRVRESSKYRSQSTDRSISPNKANSLSPQLSS